jgi:hypothetical protein
MLRVLTTTLHLGLVVGLWERLFLPSHLWHGSVGGIEQLGLLVEQKSIVCAVAAYLGSIVRSLQHHRAVAELLDQAVLPLDGFNTSATG